MADRSPPKLRVADDPISAASADLEAALARVLARHALVRLAIPGGSALAALAPVKQRMGAAWGRVALTWVDERCVAEDHADSNRGAARRLGLLENPAPARVLPLYQDGETPAEAALRAASGLRTVFGDALDVLLLGLGEDGHIASLFPSRGIFAEAPGALVVCVYDSPKPPAKRVTLTRSMLATAECAILLATGEGKRDALSRLLAGDSRLPAHGLPGLVVVTDLDLDRAGAATRESTEKR